MLLPIPLTSQTYDGKMFAGTGFLVTNNKSVWLTTCVHLLTGLKETPPVEAYFQRASLSVFGHASTLELYKNGQRRFRIVKNDGDNTLWDALSIKLDKPEIWALIAYGMHDIASIDTPEVGEDVTAIGYPGLASGMVPVQSVNAVVSLIYGETMRISESMSSGISGGPVLAGDRLVGLVYGNDNPPNEDGLVLLLRKLANILYT